jgi:hypothetical protein
MSVFFLRPHLYNGLLDDGTAWSPSIVDAALLSDNLQAVVAKVNGKINNSDMHYQQSARWISEASILPAENTTHQRGLGYRHSHDGNDSAPLRAGSILRGAVNLLDYGAFIYPSLSHNCCVIAGLAELNILANGLITDTYVAMPMDVMRYYQPAWSSCCTTGSLELPSSVTNPQSALANLKWYTLARLGSNGYGPHLEIKVYNNTGTDIIGVLFHWVTVCSIQTKI